MKSKLNLSFPRDLEEMYAKFTDLELFANFDLNGSRLNWMDFRPPDLRYCDDDDIAIMRAHTCTRSGKWSFRCSITRNPPVFSP